MARPDISFLKVYTEPEPAEAPGVETMPALAELCAAFEGLTGWKLDYRPGGDEAAAVGELCLKPTGSGRTLPRKPVERMAAALAGVLAETIAAQRALWQREAELATAVPCVPAADESHELAVRLNAVLKGGAEAVRCQAAALYLLDETTSQLKLRSAWGLPLRRLAEPARPLRGALADLEAMLGHAVVLDSPELAERWQCPETCQSAVCVPVASSTTILGTLWLFAEQPRDFSDVQTGMIEVVAGRIASELEREAALRQAQDQSADARDAQSVARAIHEELPQTAPQVEGWEVAGWTAPEQDATAAWFDWFCPDGDATGVCVGQADGRGMTGAVSASALRMAVRAHAAHVPGPDELLAHANRTLWTFGPGDRRASLACAWLDPHREEVRLATAGPLSIVVAEPDGWRVIDSFEPPLGSDDDGLYGSQTLTLPRGGLLVLSTFDVGNGFETPDGVRGPAALAALVMDQFENNARTMAAMLFEQWRRNLTDPRVQQGALAVLRRTGNG